MDNPRIFRGLSMDYPRMSMDNRDIPGFRWTSRGWGNRSAMLGEPASTFRGTARAGNINAFLIQKVRTPSGKHVRGKNEETESRVNVDLTYKLPTTKHT